MEASENKKDKEGKEEEELSSQSRKNSQYYRGHE